MGDNVGASIRFMPDGSVHHSVYDRSGEGEGARYSWSDRPDGLTDEPHFTDQGYSKGDPRRHPFG